MVKNIIQIKGVKKAFKDVEVLKGVELEVEQGGIFALLDSNGAVMHMNMAYQQLSELRMLPS